MGDFSDQFGDWSTLGIVFPGTVDWLTIPANAKNSSVFRLTFDTNWAYWYNESTYRFKSYGLLKEEYRPTGIGTSSPSTTQLRRKIIPQHEPLLVNIEPIPFDYDDDIARQLLIKRFYWSPQNWAALRPDLDIAWSVKIEALEV